MPFLYQGLCTEEGENSVICQWSSHYRSCCNPFANYQPSRGRPDLHLNL